MASVPSSAVSSPLSRVENLFEKKPRASTALSLKSRPMASSSPSTDGSRDGQKRGESSTKQSGHESKEKDATHTTPKRDTTPSDDDEEDDVDNWHGGPWSQDEVRFRDIACFIHEKR